MRVTRTRDYLRENKFKKELSAFENIFDNFKQFIKSITILNQFSRIEKELKQVLNNSKVLLIKIIYSYSVIRNFKHLCKPKIFYNIGKVI